MAGFNKSSVAASRARITSPITSATSVPDALTGNGAQAWTRDAKGELFLLAVTNMVGEDTFYESSGERDQRFRTLVRQVAREDADWIKRFIPWLRSEANMRTASVVAAVEAAMAVDGMRETVAAALQRPDEPGEALAYIAAQYGGQVRKPIKRGIADAVQRMYSERNLLKFDSDAKDFRFGDVLELTHAKAKDERQGDLFAYAISKRHRRDELAIPESLTMLHARAQFDAVDVGMRRAFLFGGGNETPAERLARAGMTWESLSGWLQGPMDAKAWEAMIPNMGYMALLRNLRNFDQAGVSDGVAAGVAAKLADADEVAKSRQLPMRFLSAYNAAPSLRWAWALESALKHSLANVPELKGRTLIMVDVSTSMNQGFSKDGSLKRWDAAALFGIALAQRAEAPEVVAFASDTKVFPVQKGGSVLKQLESFRKGYFSGGGTATAPALQRHFTAHDRVIILTDEQADGYSHGFGGAWGSQSRVTVTDAIPQTVPMYNFNLAGYRAGSTPSGKENRHAFGGLTDTGFKMIGLLESRKRASWPF